MENQLVKAQQSKSSVFYDTALESLEQAKEYAQLLLDSKLVPTHFYEKKMQDGRTVPDYSKGNVGAVLMTIQHGLELKFSITQALQQVVPINGLMTVKGDGCKSLIFSSGKCDKWGEKVEGSIEGGDYKVTIYSKRKDNGNEITRSFDLFQAKRAGLYYSDNDLKSLHEKRRNAYKYSPWYKYPERMVMYRVIGFMARDLYPDILQGTVTYEEAIDYPEEGKITVIEREGKQPLQIDESKVDDALNDTSKISSKFVEEDEKDKDKIVNKPKRGRKPKAEKTPTPETQEDSGDNIKGEDLPEDSNQALCNVKGPTSKDPHLGMDLQPNKDFDKQKDESGDGFVIPELNDGKRGFKGKKAIHDKLKDLGVDYNNFTEHIKGTRLFGNYDDLMQFCDSAPADEVQILFNKLS